MSTDNIRANIHRKIGESIREMENYIDQYRANPDDTTLINWIGCHAEYMAGLYRDERKFESTLKSLDRLNSMHG